MIAFFGLAGLALIQEFIPWLLFRFMFGGGLGMFFRVVEYWLNTVTCKKNRGRIMGTYSVCFLGGIIAGSILQPSIGTYGVMPYAYIFLSLIFTVFLLMWVNFSAVPNNTDKVSESINLHYLVKLFDAAPIAMAGVIAYGLFEDVPAYLLSVYALRVGFPEDIAAYTLTAFALGNLLFAIPLGVLSDKVGRLPILCGSAIIGCLGAALIPVSLSNSSVFLIIILIWGGCIGSIYSMCLAVIGDQFDSKNLISANATFGIFYASAALLGPLLNGIAMQLWEPNGLMLSCGLIFGGFLYFAIRATRKQGIFDAV
jgi:MFS family permease